MKATESVKIAKRSAVRDLKVKVLGDFSTNANGPDFYIFLKNRPISVEVKPTRRTRRGSLQVSPVEPNRRSDDLIAIVFPTGYVLWNSMEDHMKLCTAKGYRTLSFLDATVWRHALPRDQK